jgi:hypothetical protein
MNHIAAALSVGDCLQVNAAGCSHFSTPIEIPSISHTIQKAAMAIPASHHKKRILVPDRGGGEI